MTTTYTVQKISVIGMIRSVIVDGDTSKEITEKVIIQYPEYLDRKIDQKGSEDIARAQIRSEVSARLGRETKDIIIDRSESTYRYSLIVDDVEDIEDTDFDDATVFIDTTKTDRELDVSYIYIIDVHYLTPDGRKVVKIGKANDIEKRIHQIYSVELGVYEPTLLYSWKVQRPFKVEKGLHDILDLARLNPKRELFDAEYVEKKMSMIEMIIEDFVIN